MTVRILVCVMVLVVAPAVVMGVPVIFVTDVEFLATEAVSLLVSPDGNGTAFEEARTIGGEVVDASIGFRLVDEFGSPIAMYPFEDVYLDLSASNARHCAGYPVILADADSGPDGRMRFSGSVRGGGWIDQPLPLTISGMPAQLPGGEFLAPFPIHLNSPDISGDGIVDLTDIVLFAGDLGGGAGYRSDFIWDGDVNLSDIVVFTQHLGLECD